MFRRWSAGIIFPSGAVYGPLSQCKNTQFFPNLIEPIPKSENKPAIAAMHGPHTVSDLGHCTVIHGDIGSVSLVDQ